ncbi:unnamed protein product, partial [Phaeothamnion confervicola]
FSLCAGGRLSVFRLRRLLLDLSFRLKQGLKAKRVCWMDAGIEGKRSRIGGIEAAGRQWLGPLLPCATVSARSLANAHFCVAPAFLPFCFLPRSAHHRNLICCGSGCGGGH